MILETKCDESFLLGQFYIDAFNPPFCLDRSSSGGARKGGGVHAFCSGRDIP